MARQGSTEDVTLEKALPSSIEAERLILGVILLDNTAINLIIMGTRPSTAVIAQLGTHLTRPE